MKIYTKTGDLGETGLSGGSRVFKDVPRIEATGAVDELNAVLGVARARDTPEAIERLLEVVQNRLFDLGAELAAPDASERGSSRIAEPEIEELEAAIDRFEAGLSPLLQFILPAGTPLTAQLHLARTVCRRAERRVVTLARMPEETVAPQVVTYLNRLSDLLFVLARAASAAAGQPDVPWQPLAPARLAARPHDTGRENPKKDP